MGTIIRFIRTYLWVTPLLLAGYLFTIAAIDWYKVHQLISIAQSKNDPAWGLISEQWNKVANIWMAIIPIPFAHLLTPLIPKKSIK